MKEYKFLIYLTLDDETTHAFHTVFATSYQKAYSLVLNEIPHNYTYDFFTITPRYRVNGRRRISK